MDKTSTPTPTGYVLPEWFIRHNVKSASQLAGLVNQVKFCSCDGCKAFKADDESLMMAEAPEARASRDNEHSDSLVTDRELAQGPCTDEIHYKTFAELRDVTCAALLSDEKGKLISQPEALGVVLRMEHDSTSITEPTWAGRAVLHMAKEMGVSLVTLDMEDLEDLGCEFHHQDQAARLKETASTVILDTVTTDPRMHDANGGNHEREDVGKKERSPDPDWKPDPDSFATFLSRYFAGRSKRKGEPASYERNQRAFSAVLDAAIDSADAFPVEDRLRKLSPRAVIFHIIDCTYLEEALPYRSKRRILTRFAEVVRKRREQGQAVVLLVSTEAYDLQPGHKSYQKMGATEGSIVFAKVSHMDDTQSRKTLRKGVINARRIQRRLREQIHHLLPAELINVHADWGNKGQGLGPELLGHELWSSSNVSTAVRQLMGRAWKRPRLDLSDIRAVLRRMGMYVPVEPPAAETVQNEKGEHNEDCDGSLDSFDLDEDEDKLRQCVVSRDALKTGWDDVIVGTETMELLQQLVSPNRLEIDSASELLLRELRVGGALLYGPPGTGKTHIGRAVAKASGSRMLALDAATLQSKWTGEAEKHIRAAFTLATKLHPCVLFLDEVDSLFYRRSSEDKSWERSFITQFLQCMDGLLANDKAPFVIAATNRPWDIDEAFLRRLPEKIYLGLPNKECRARILRLFLKEHDLDPAVNIDGLAQVTEKYSGSDLKSLCIHAALIWRAQEIRMDWVYNSLSTKFSQANQGPKKMQLGVDHFVEALHKIQPNKAEDLLPELERFSRRYHPTASNSSRNPGNRFIYNDLTKRHEMLHVRELISHTPQPEDTAFSPLKEPENEMQVQAWCQLCLREHFMHRARLVSIFLLGVTFAIRQDRLQTPLDASSVRPSDGTSDSTDPSLAQAEPISRLLQSASVTTDSILTDPSSESRLITPKASIPDDLNSSNDSSLTALLNLPVQKRADALLSENRARNHVRVMAQQTHRYYVEQNSSVHHYYKRKGQSRGIFLIQPPPGSEETSADDESNLAYEPLPNASSIRLLKLRPARNIPFPPGGQGSEDLNLVLDPIQCSLIIQDLDQNPIFDALSYTWGDPCTVYFKQDWDFSRDQAGAQKAWNAKSMDIFVDGKPVSVGMNLYMALQAVRGVWAKQSLNGRGLGRFSGTVWVDAVCINQQDLAEKTSQVTMMSRIYRQAQNVLAWIGGEDSHSRQSIRDLRNISKAIFGNISLFDGQTSSERWAGYNLENRKTYAELGIPTISKRSWAGIYAFTNRAWFKRAWIVQEVCFSKNPILICGLVQVSLRRILEAFLFLQWSRWSLELYKFVRMQNPSEPDVNIGSMLSHTRIPLYQSRESNSLNPNWGRMILWNRIALGVEKNARLVDRDRNAVDFQLDLQTLLHHHRSTEAGDPRDKIYAFLGLAHDKYGAVKLIADYSLPVRAVYIQAMKFLIASSGNLGSLSLRESVRESLYEITAEGTKEPVHLPTWVPNFNAENIPGPMAHYSWMASKGLGPVLHDVLEHRLRVSGVQVGAIEDSVGYSDLQLFELAKFFEDFLSRSSNLGPQVFANDGSHDDAYHIEQRRLPSESKQRSLDVLWRTLCCDSYGSMSPAPSQCGKAFTDLLRFTVMQHEAISIGGTCGWFDDEEMKMHANVDLAMCHDPDEARIQAGRSYTGLLKLMGLLCPGSDDEIVHSPELLSIEKEIASAKARGEMVDFGRVASFIDRGAPASASKECSAFRHEMQMNILRRKLFATNDGRLGLAPSTLQSDDEVWILAGGDSPFILRRQTTEGEYEMVGLAYVHGIMRGEAVQHVSQGDVRSITLV